MEELKVSRWKDFWNRTYRHGYGDKITFRQGKLPFLQPYIKEYLFPNWRELTKADDVLEIGVGNGAIAWSVAPRVGSFVGTDISDVAIEMSEARFRGHNNVQFLASTEILLLHKQFDLIYAITVFQHIPRSYTKQYIFDAYKCLKPGGCLFFNVISGMQDKNVAEVPDKFIDPAIGFSEEHISSFCREAGFSNFDVVKMDVKGACDRFWWLFVIANKV